MVLVKVKMLSRAKRMNKAKLDQLNGDTPESEKTVNVEKPESEKIIKDEKITNGEKPKALLNDEKPENGKIFHDEPTTIIEGEWIIMIL